MSIEIMTSYFYQIRFMKHYMIPLSTCLSDPKYFHQNKSKDFFFKDKNNVYNGLRAEPFVPQLNDFKCVGPQNCNLKPDDCGFYLKYYNQLNSLDFESIMRRFERLGSFIKEKENFIENPIMILIVYEKPDNPCSERVVIKKWFKDNGIEVKEFNKEFFNKS